MMHYKLLLPSLFAASIIALAWVIPGNVAQSGTLLYERTVSVNRSSNIFSTDEFDLDLVFGDNQFAPTNGVTLFDSLIVSPADVGSTFSADAGSDTEFATVAGRVTDAQNEFMNLSLTEDLSGGLTEQRIWQENRFFQQLVPVNPPDLAGMELGSINVKVESFTFMTEQNEESSNSQPVDLVLTVSFLGIVPEPTSVALVAVGLFANMLRRRGGRH